jgi:hypothetical protein
MFPVHSVTNLRGLYRLATSQESPTPLPLASQAAAAVPAMTLNSLIQIALENQPRIRAAEAAVRKLAHA